MGLAYCMFGLANMLRSRVVGVEWIGAISKVSIPLFVGGVDAD